MVFVKQVKFLQNKYSARLPLPGSIGNFNFSLALRKLWEYLPVKAYCDRLVTIYFRCFERCVRILHRPTFMRQYEELWLSDNWEMCSPSIIPQLTAIMTAAYHVDDAGPDNATESPRKYLRGAAVDLIQAWLNGLNRKQRTELSTLQVQLLLLPSRILTDPHPEKLWSSAGAIVRSAMLMGLHLDPTGMKDCSPYQVEMRWRLWASVLEIDLQTSMMVDLPLAVPELNSYHPVPSNLNDDDFDEHSKTLPVSHPLNDLTDSLYQIYLAASLPPRLKAVSLVQRFTSDAREIMEMGRKIGECLCGKPSVLGLQYGQVTSGNDGSLLNRVHLDIHMRRTLQYIYRPLLFTEQPHTATLAEIQRLCLQSSLAILSYKDLYTTGELELVHSNTKVQDDVFNHLCKTDLLWAGLTVCQHIKLLRMPMASSPLQQEKVYDEAVLVKTVERTVEYFIDRICCRGSDLKDSLFLSLALKWVQLPDSHADKSHELRQHTRQILVTCIERLLQPLISPSDYRRDPQGYGSQQGLPPTKRPRMLPPSAYLDMDATTVPKTMSGLIHPPPQLNSFSDRTNDAATWLRSYPSLAAGYSNYQMDMYDDAHDSFGFGFRHDWDWGNMWR